MPSSRLLGEIDDVLAEAIPDRDQRRRAIIAFARHFGGSQVYVPPPRASEPIVREAVLRAHRAGTPPREIRAQTGLAMTAIYNVLRDGD